MLTVEIESFAAAIPELKPLFEVHWRELALFQDKMPLAPQYQEYIERENAGRLFLVAARFNGKIVGYWTVQVAPGFHYGTTLTAHTDIIYIAPEYRNRGIILPLYRCVEKELKRRGVQIFYAGSKTHNPLGLPGVYELLGFVPADTYVVKWISET